jgi:hypothetical protein
MRVVALATAMAMAFTAVAWARETAWPLTMVVPPVLMAVTATFEFPEVSALGSTGGPPVAVPRAFPTAVAGTLPPVATPWTALVS